MSDLAHKHDKTCPNELSTTGGTLRLCGPKFLTPQPWLQVTGDLTSNYSTNAIATSLKST